MYQAQWGMLGKPGPGLNAGRVVTVLFVVPLRFSEAARFDPTTDCEGEHAQVVWKKTDNGDQRDKVQLK